MCGINGIITRDFLSPELRAAVSRMNGAQVHRGPDGAGEYQSDNLSLAMRRLSIIDPEGGWQPLYNKDKSLVLIFNGEIYNYIELRQQLKKNGRNFQTKTDGEVILHLYEEDETNFVKHLRGMFAFALWDANRQRLILARDRMGEKPLYIYENERVLLFSSELKGLLHSGIVPFELDAYAINLFFHYQYVPEPLTPLKNVRKLDAATLLTLDVKTWNLTERHYWKMYDAPPIEGVPHEVIREKLEETSELIIRSDVPVGVALSGGLDSSLVAAFVARKHPEALCALSVGYEGRPESDERADAKALSDYLGVRFIDVELDTNTIVNFFPKLNYWRDDPIADYSGFGYYAVMKLARENDIPVMLQGQGGDELFWGYSQLREALKRVTGKSELINSSFRRTIRERLKLNFRNGFSRNSLSNWLGYVKNPTNFGRFFLYDTSTDFNAAYSDVKTFYSQKFSAEIAETDVTRLFTFPDGWSSAEITLTALVCATYLRENGITQGDRLGMASFVEMRLPLVDYKFVETVIGLRKRISDADLEPKQWLKDSAKGLLPDWVLNRKKRGFEPPVRLWHNALFDKYGDSLSDGFLVKSEILSREGAKVLSKGAFPKDVTSPLSFKALVLEYWCREMSAICCAPEPRTMYTKEI